MKIGILETGLLNVKVADRFDPYPVMFAALLDKADLLDKFNGGLTYRTYSVINGEMPASIDDCDGWLITGSRHGVYEKLDWMLSLESFIRTLYEENKPLVGICFGHQIIAQALGGSVTKSDKGWGIGLHQYKVDVAQSWMAAAPSSAPKKISIYAFHQDQISQLPTASTVFLSSDFCPYAGLTYGDSILSVQAHPEFEAIYEHALIDIYNGNIVPESVATDALMGMQGEDSLADTQILANWIAHFFLNQSHIKN
ncbi:MAG: GMP synthase-like glutamine amidotransferase [Chitinophagales bacterium]|jgi:GMP synthase-like glutamine amidotransferase